MECMSYDTSTLRVADYENGLFIRETRSGLFVLEGTYHGAIHCLGEYRSLKSAMLEYDYIIGDNH